MTQFLDGPAQKITLSLRRAPVMLRVVKSPRQWDALDMPTDEPAPDEEIFVYRLVGEATYMHLNCRGKHRDGSGWYACAQYTLYPEQPSPRVTCSAVAWSAWCDSIQDAVMALRKQEAIDRSVTSGEAVSPAAPARAVLSTCGPRVRAGSVHGNTPSDQDGGAGSTPVPALAPTSPAMPSDAATSTGGGGRIDDDQMLLFPETRQGVRYE